MEKRKIKFNEIFLIPTEVNHSQCLARCGPNKRKTLDGSRSEEKKNDWKRSSPKLCKIGIVKKLKPGCFNFYEARNSVASPFVINAKTIAQEPFLRDDVGGEVERNKLVISSCRQHTTSEKSSAITWRCRVCNLPIAEKLSSRACNLTHITR